MLDKSKHMRFSNFDAQFEIPRSTGDARATKHLLTSTRFPRFTKPSKKLQSAKFCSPTVLYKPFAPRFVVGNFFLAASAPFGAYAHDHDKDMIKSLNLKGEQS
ncbi:MAG: hypothetical protein NVV73_01390 [Cellvibrionaceae bacterium]|nr:hypothetical protein [Cellvibrionaceae bacterium]